MVPLSLSGHPTAEVAELADAQASGACGLRLVGVQIPPSAPRFPGTFNRRELQIRLQTYHGNIRGHFLEHVNNPPMAGEYKHLVLLREFYKSLCSNKCSGVIDLS